MANPEQSKRLDSWKEIAEYLGRDVRTVVRWEKEKGLPVRRVPGGKRQSVFAMTGEIDEWLLHHKESREFELPPASFDADAPAAGNAARRRTSMLVSAGVGVFAVLGLAVLIFNQGRGPAEAPPAAIPLEIEFQAAQGPLRYLRSELEVSPFAYTTAAGDFNADGKVDLVFGTTPADVIGVLLGKGDGSFLPARLYEDCAGADRLVVADFNRDGHQDIAVACFVGNAVAVFWGKGDGTFPERTKIAVPGGPRFLALGDLNQDGWPDLAVAAFGEPALYVLTNHTGQFTSALISRFEAVGALAVADFNGDEHLDVIASIRAGKSFGLQLFTGKGDASLRPATPFFRERKLSNLAAGIEAVDVSGDGIADLVLSVWNDRLMISLGDGRGGFSGPASLSGAPASPGVSFAAVADLDQDGKLDILILGSDTGAAELFRGMGDGTFASGGVAKVAAGTVYNPLAADFNNDGQPDIAMNAVFDRRLVFLISEGKRPAPR